MQSDNYLLWLANETPTAWWHDSGDPEELSQGIARGAVGVTTNPVLTYRALWANPDYFGPKIRVLPDDLTPERRAEELMGIMVRNAAKMFEPIYERTDGKMGYVCGQLNPARAWDVETMLAAARRYHAWAPNISVKVPVTLAGLDVMEELAAEGITFTATVSYNVPQLLEVAKRYQKGLTRARQAGTLTGRCFVTQMIGRIDDYLRDVACDNKTKVSESDIRQAGLAMAKRTYAIYKEQGYEAVLLIAALRGTYHMVELAGGEIIMSIHPRYQAMLLQPDVPRELRIDVPIAPEVIRRLETIPEFVRSYEPDGMTPEEFISFGVVQRTLTQFDEVGWKLIESFRLGR